MKNFNIFGIGLLLFISLAGVNAGFNCQYKKDGYYSDEDYCHIYWRCNYGVAEEYECPAGTAWNHIENKCDWLDFVDCNRFNLKKFTKEAEDNEDNELTTKNMRNPTKKNTEEIIETTTLVLDETTEAEYTGAETRTDMIQDDEELLMMSTPIFLTTTARVEPPSTTIKITTTISPTTQTLPTTTLTGTTDSTITTTTTTTPKLITSSIIVTLTSQASFLTKNTTHIILRDAQTNSTQTTTTSTSTTTTTTTITTTITTPIPTTTFNYEGICDDVFEAGMFKEDPFVCNNYIRCNHGVAQLFTCPKNTVWDAQNKICLWTQQVECAERELVTEKTPNKSNNNKKKTKKTTLPKTTTEITTTEPVTTTNNKRKNAASAKAETYIGTDKPIVCQSFGSYYIPDSSNCASYFMCNIGKETKMSCPDKQLFNSETTQCEDFQQVFCGARPVNMAERNQCASKRDGIYPDVERACRVFYQCVNMQKIREATCPNSLKFNMVTSRCDNPANIMAPCGTNNPSSSSTSYINHLSSTKTLLFSVFLMAAKKLF